MATKYEIDAQIAEVRRELALRGNVYRHRVAQGKMEQSEADEHLGKMQAVHDTLEWVRDNREEILAIMKEKRNGG